MNNILTFTILTSLLVMSPGPNLALILKTVSSKGKGSGVLNVSGFVLAVFFQGAFSILGLSALIVKSAELFLLVKIIGSLYLFYIGVKAVHQSFFKSTPVSRLVQPDRPKNKVAFRSFSEGFLTQFLNPKGSMFYLAAFPQFIDLNSPVYLEAFVLVLIHAVLMTVWFTSACIVISNIKELGAGGLLGRWVQRVSGAFLIVFSSILLTQEAKI